jgi:hypothetical protein
VNGHANDVLTDNGDGTFKKVKGDMRGSHQGPEESPAAISQPIQGDEIRPTIEDESASKSQQQSQFQNDLDWAVGMGLQEYQSAKQHGVEWGNHEARSNDQPWDKNVVGRLKTEAGGETQEAGLALEGVDEFAHQAFEGDVGLQFELDQAWNNDVGGEVDLAALGDGQGAWTPALEDAGEHGNLALEDGAEWQLEMEQEWSKDLFS